MFLDAALDIGDAPQAEKDVRHRGSDFAGAEAGWPGGILDRKTGHARPPPPLGPNRRQAAAGRPGLPHSLSPARSRAGKTLRLENGTSQAASRHKGKQAFDRKKPLSGAVFYSLTFTWRRVLAFSPESALCKARACAPDRRRRRSPRDPVAPRKSHPPALRAGRAPPAPPACLRGPAHRRRRSASRSPFRTFRNARRSRAPTWGAQRMGLQPPDRRVLIPFGGQDERLRPTDQAMQLMPRRCPAKVTSASVRATSSRNAASSGGSGQDEPLPGERGRLDQRRPRRAARAAGEDEIVGAVPIPSGSPAHRRNWVCRPASRAASPTRPAFSR